VDVVVLGGGPAGVSTAMVLAESGISVLVVERSGYTELRIGETFPPAIQCALVPLGLWESFISSRHLPSSGTCSAWGRDELQEYNFFFNPYGHGWHVDRRAFDASLALAAEARGVRFARDSRILDVEQQPRSGGWRLSVGSTDCSFDVKTSFLVDATGRASVLARRLGATRSLLDGLIGMYRFYKETSQQAIEALTLIEAVEGGWWYSAPLPGGRVVAAYMSDADLCARDALRDLSCWNVHLQRAPHTYARVCHSAPEGKPAVVAANSSILRPMFGSDWLAVGDAALAFDPLSGQGVCKALESGLSAGRAIDDCIAGRNASLQDFAVRAEESFDGYMRTRVKYYAQEGRWPTSAFWRRRHLGHNGKGTN
jgi:flavin-dependent dehydrogenase